MDRLIIKSVKLISPDGIFEAKENRGKYTYSDVSISINDCGTVVVSADKTPLFKTEISIANNYFDNDAIILGDEWERAYGNLEWREPEADRIMPWYFVAYNKEKTYGFGVETLPNSLCSWRLNGDEIVLTLDLRSGTNGLLLDSRELEACKIVYAEFGDDLHKATFEFCRLMCKNPRLPKITAIYGGNDWYCNYGDNSYERILNHSRRIVECSKNAKGKPFMVIDDGWQICHRRDEICDFNGGPWKYCNSRFKDMKKMAEAISNEGAIPGIWFRPLLTAEKMPDEYLLRKYDFSVVLDPSSDGALEKIASDVKTIREWGYKLIKHDFTSIDIFGVKGCDINNSKVEMNFHDKTKTTAQIIKKLYYTIRNAAGDDVLIMGCNTMTHLSAGIFEIQRTGDDTSGIEWERTKKYGINTLAFRMAQHKSFYIADADCVGITNSIPWQKNKEWLDVLAKSGTALFVSIADDAYTEEIKRDITAAFEFASTNEKSSYPVDWISTSCPKIWQSECGLDTYEW